MPDSFGDQQWRSSYQGMVEFHYGRFWEGLCTGSNERVRDPLDDYLYSVRDLDHEQRLRIAQREAEYDVKRAMRATRTK